MSHDQFHPDPMEAALGRLETAERAGVFHRTDVDVATLLRSANDLAPISFARRIKRVLPFAAAAVLVAGVWGTMWDTELNRLRTQKLAMVENDCDGSFLTCFQGLRSSQSVCRTYDYDRDGDVDLADYGTYQMSCDGPVAMR